jgi:hypothetical protein
MDITTTELKHSPGSLAGMTTKELRCLATRKRVNVRGNGIFLKRGKLIERISDDSADNSARQQECVERQQSSTASLRKVVRRPYKFGRRKRHEKQMYEQDGRERARGKYEQDGREKARVKCEQEGGEKARAKYVQEGRSMNEDKGRVKAKTIWEREGRDQANSKDAEEVSQKAWSKYESGDSDKATAEYERKGREKARVKYLTEGREKARAKYEKGGREKARLYYAKEGREKARAKYLAGGREKARARYAKERGQKARVEHKEKDSENAMAVYEQKGSSQARVKDEQEGRSKVRAMYQQKGPVPDVTPDPIKALSPPGSTIVQMKSRIRAYEGCHRKCNPRRWILRRWGGPVANRTEFQALREVLDQLWDWHESTGENAHGRPRDDDIRATLANLSLLPSKSAAVEQIPKSRSARGQGGSSSSKCHEELGEDVGNS